MVFLTLADLGEEEILNRISYFAPKGQINDDTAQIKSNQKDLLINSDLMIEEVHFSELTTNPNNVGWRVIAANLSDLAASGVDEIIGITVCLVAPPETKWAWVEGVYQGMKEALDEFGGSLLGGDCSRGKQKLLAVTAIGTTGPIRLHRSQAQPGDSLVVSGAHGLSRMGLALLSNDALIKSLNLPEKLKQQAITKHQRPIPPLQALKTLVRCKPKGIPWRAAGTDSSDGLLQALKNLCKESKCQAVIDQKNLPRISQWPTGAQWDEWCLNGGEDYELVISLPPAWAKAWLSENPACKEIGFMQAGKPRVLWNESNEEIKSQRVFKHFKI